MTASMKLVSIPAPMKITAQMMACNEGSLGIKASVPAAHAVTVSLLRCSADS